MSYEVKGIDVSSWQGKINWYKVKQTDIKFAMIRLIDFDSKTNDEYFKYNVEECIKYGIPFGIYAYSRAMNVEQAQKEANYIVKELAPYKEHIRYPVAIDMEDADGYKKKRGMPSREILSKICATECDIFEKAGYYSIIYTGLYFAKDNLDEKIIEKYDKWIAQYYSRCTYKNNHGMWQYSSKGRVDGITANVVDMDIAYYDYPAWYEIQKNKKEEPKKESEDEIMIAELINKYGNQVVLEALSRLCEVYKNREEISEWAEDTVKQAIVDGITDGSRMGDFATREEVVTMITRKKQPN